MRAGDTDAARLPVPHVGIQRLVGVSVPVLHQLQEPFLHGIKVEIPFNCEKGFRVGILGIMCGYLTLTKGSDNRCLALEPSESKHEVIPEGMHSPFTNL
jgi:hypothetical protein